MSKKLLALLLAVAMVLSVLPFSVFAEEVVEGDTPVVEETVDLTYSSGLDDGATYALKVPTNQDTFGQAYQWSSGGFNLDIVHEENESFVAFNERAITYFQENHSGSWNTSIYAAGTTYGGDELAQKHQYAGGIPETADISETAYIALRIKFNDNSPVGSYDVSRFIPYLSVGGGQRGMHGTTTDIPAYWYDLTDGSYNPWYGNNGFWKATEGAFSFVGDADGYLILPYALNSNVTAAALQESFKNIQIFFYTNDAVVSGDNQKKKSDWTDKEFLLGDCFFIEDIEKFVTARNEANGIVRYSSNKGDGAWIANKINGATRNAVRGWAWSTGKLFCDPYTDSNSSSYNYAHVATISDDEVGVVFKMNEGKSSGNASVPLNGTYETSRHATDKFQGADGIPAAIDLDNITYLAQRVIFKGSEANPLNGQGFRLYLNNASQAHCSSAADIILINKDKSVTKLKYNGGLDFYEDFDGWILAPKSGWADTQWTDAHTNWSGGFQYFYDGDCSGTTLIVGNMYFVEDATKFYQFHGAPALEIEAGADSLTVKDVEEGAIYSIDGFETSNTTGVFEGLEKDAKYTISAKYEIGTAVVEKEIWTDPFATHVNDTGYNYMPVPNEETYIKYVDSGKNGVGWSSDWIWKNLAGEYSSSSGNAGLYVVDVDGETFFDITLNPEKAVDQALPFCPSLGMAPNYLATGTSRFENTAYNTDDMTHLAFRFKLTGLAEGKVAKLGLISDPSYFWDCSTAYLIDYDTREVIDPEWTGEAMIFEKNFNGWVVFPIDDMASDATHDVTYNVVDEEGNPVYEEDGETQKTEKYAVSFRESLFAEIDPINGEKNAATSFQFWFHNDDESNDDGAGNEGCSHWVGNSDWRGTTLYMGDMVVFSDKETFDTVRTSCDLHGHDLVAGDVVAPTCTDEGYTTYTCNYCDYTENKDIVEALGHAYEEAVTEPDCENGGFTTYTCTVCGDTYDDNFTDALGHTLITIDETPATCTEGGYIMEMCEICGYTDEYETVPDGHKMGEGVVTAPTCTEAGYTTYTCSVCGETEVRDEVEALGHSYEAVVTEPTCTDAGYTTYTCPVCGDSYVGDEVEALGHSYVETVVPPTETEQGYTDHTCSVCGDNYKDNYTDPVTPEEPEVPTNKVSGVTVTEGDISITVSWDAFEGADRYVVKALKPDGTALTTKTVTEGTSVEITGFEYDTVYTFFVVARVGGKYQTQEDADIVSGQLKLGDRVVGIKSSVKGRTITVEWMAFPGATQYYVFVYPKGADPTVSSNRVTTVNAGANTSVGIINAISPETDYEIYVSARVNGKYQTLENALYTSAVIPVTAPSSFEITSIEPTIVRIKWPAVKNADRYWARLVAEDGETVVMTKQSLKALISFTKLTPGATYYVQLQARVPKSSGGNQYSGYCDPILTQPITLPTE